MDGYSSLRRTPKRYLNNTSTSSNPFQSSASLSNLHYPSSYRPTSSLGGYSTPSPSPTPSNASVGPLSPSSSQYPASGGSAGGYSGGSSGYSSGVSNTYSPGASNTYSPGASNTYSPGASSTYSPGAGYWDDDGDKGPTLALDGVGDGEGVEYPPRDDVGRYDDG